jgi:aspartyl-tRNA synthetase
LIPKGRWELCWITGFPLFEWSETENAWVSAQHPFTGIVEEDLDLLEQPKRRGEIRSKGYDLVLNGYELGSGSLRIHRQDVQARVFRALGLSAEEQQSRFGFFLEALQYGTPPHGGIALGLDRIVMILAGAESLREVIPFPKTAKAQDLMAESPSPVSQLQVLQELHLLLADAIKHECPNRDCKSELTIWSGAEAGPGTPLICLFCGSQLPWVLSHPYSVMAHNPATGEWREGSG